MTGFVLGGWGLVTRDSRLILKQAELVASNGLNKGKDAAKFGVVEQDVEPFGHVL